VKCFVYTNDTDKLPDLIKADPRLLKAFSYNVIKSKGEKLDKEIYFVVPILFLLDELNRHDRVQQAMREYCRTLEHWEGNEERHIFLDQSDFCRKPDAIAKSLIFTVTPQASNTTHRALPFYPHRHESLDIPRLMSKPISKAGFDLFFKGCDSSMPLRKEMLNLASCYERDGLSTYIQTYGRYFWNRDITDEEKDKERIHYFERLTDSKFVLCPRGTGTTSSRFFEALYFGRIPVLISDDARLPLENKINWSNISVRIPEDEMGSLARKVREFEALNNIEEVSSKIKEISHTYFVRESMLKLICDTLN
jgi:hypothetical protein